MAPEKGGPSCYAVSESQVIRPVSECHPENGNHWFRGERAWFPGLAINGGNGPIWDIGHDFEQTATRETVPLLACSNVKAKELALEDAGYSLCHSADAFKEGPAQFGQYH
jgi:hypothetical protein